MAKLSEAARNKIAVMRARARLNTGKKKKSGGRRRGGGGGSRGGFLGTLASLGGKGGGLFELGSVAVIGSVVLGRLVDLPAWLSPIGAMIWLYGWYTKNQTIRTVGMLIIALGLVDVLGIPSAIGAKVDEAKAKGLFSMLKNASASSTAGGTPPSGAGANRNSIDKTAADAVDVANSIRAVSEAINGGQQYAA